jgi:hypothetical protein
MLKFMNLNSFRLDRNLHTGSRIRRIWNSKKTNDEIFFLKNQFYAPNVDKYEILKLEKKNRLSNHMIQNQQKSSITTTHHLWNFVNLFRFGKQARIVLILLRLWKGASFSFVKFYCPENNFKVDLKSLFFL